MQNKLELPSSAAGLEGAAKRTRDAMGSLARFLQTVESRGPVTMELAARDFSYALARIYAGSGEEKRWITEQEGARNRSGIGLGSHFLGRGWSSKKAQSPLPAERGSSAWQGLREGTTPLPTSPGTLTSPLPQELF